ncbi:hypothetical protein [Methylobacterium currus]|jgi:hypothetical protein|uniref:hypothetical protein n=1 Tax=Methylobacterium currus TaxID=2051553 RepID=UPI000F4F88F8|nr:hypothetical protein [Methylobacterium currus]
MRILILFSMWAPDDSENSRKWLEYYKYILRNNFKEDDKFISINGCKDLIDASNLNDIENLIGSSRVADDMVIDSDASGYQHALRHCNNIIAQYDAVCLFHTKGISYNFEDSAGLRIELSENIFDRERVTSELVRHDKSIVALKGYMAPSSGAIRHFIDLAADANIHHSCIHYAATLTLYAVSSAALCDLMACLPDRIMSQNLKSIGENRYFFEAMFPSLLTAIGARPVFLCGEQFEESANCNVSYDALSAHNSAIVSREFFRCREQGSLYQHRPFPYVTGTQEQVAKINIIFDIE